MVALDIHDSEQMADISSGATTISDKIRALTAAGFKRADIARFLDRRYQQVNNVLVQDAKRAARRGANSAGQVESSTGPTADDAEPVWTKLGEGGRLVVPAGMRKALGIAEGDNVQLACEDGCVVIRSRDEALRHAQRLFGKYAPDGVSLADELIADRRAEVAREAHDE